MFHFCDQETIDEQFAPRSDVDLGAGVDGAGEHGTTRNDDSIHDRKFYRTRIEANQKTQIV
ncbi:MAG: hypothetical protein CMO80_02125 [Verrucomicrobiales bacterium]|nr:hypothetical protein [Verrucomicrobiales bacterium]